MFIDISNNSKILSVNFFFTAPACLHFLILILILISAAALIKIVCPAVYCHWWIELDIFREDVRN